MYRSSFELSVVDDTGQQNRVRWRFVWDGEDSVFADAVAEGCRRLNLDNKFYFVIYETLKFDDKKPTGRLLQQDECVEPDKKYVIVGRTVYENGTNTAEPLICSSSLIQCFSPPRQTLSTSTRQTLSTSTRQTLSTSTRQTPSAANQQNGPNDAETLTYSCYSTPRLSVSTR